MDTATLTPLVAIIGPRASGKSRLIDSILAGEHRDVLGLPEGDLFVQGDPGMPKPLQGPTLYHFDTRLRPRWRQPEIAKFLRNATKKVILIRTPEQLRINMRDRLSRCTNPKRARIVQANLQEYQDSKRILKHNQRMIEAFPEALIW